MTANAPDTPATASSGAPRARPAGRSPSLIDPSTPNIRPCTSPGTDRWNRVNRLGVRDRDRHAADDQRDRNSRQRHRSDDGEAHAEDGGTAPRAALGPGTPLAIEPTSSPALNSISSKPKVVGPAPNRSIASAAIIIGTGATTMFNVVDNATSRPRPGMARNS